MEFGAGRELYLVPARGQRLDDGWGRRGVLPRLRLRCGNSVWTEFEDRALVAVPSHEETTRGSRPSLGNLAHHPGSVRPGRDLGDLLLDLTLRPVGGSFQEPVPVLAGEVRGQLGNRGQVKTAIRQHGQEHRMLPRRPGRRDAE